jgi:transcriptional regulator with XRE-family HTH domain
VEDSGQRETVGQRIRRVRLEKGLSQRDLSAPGVTYAYISRIENGGRRPSLKAIRLIAKRLGVNPEYLETGELIPGIVDREIRLSDAELELRLHGDLEKAEAVFRAVVGEKDAEPVLVARARAGLGLLASHRGDDVGAINHLTAAVESGYMPPEARPDVYETLGAAQSAAGQSAAAAELFERCLTKLRRGAETREGEEAVRAASLEIRFTAYLANAYSEIGEMERARVALDEALAIEEASPEARVIVLWTRARLSWMRSEGYAALDYIKTAIGFLDATEDRLQLARAHLACAQLTNLDARPREATRHLTEAEELFRQGADATDLGVLRAEQAKVAAMEGRADDTFRLAAEADELLGDDVRYSALKAHVRGIAYALMGDIDQAGLYFQTAVYELERRRQWREATDVARSWARLLRAAGRAAEALDVMDRAAVLGARQLGAETRQARAYKPEPRRSRT